MKINSHNQHNSTTMAGIDEFSAIDVSEEVGSLKHDDLIARFKNYQVRLVSASERNKIQGTAKKVRKKITKFAVLRFFSRIARWILPGRMTVNSSKHDNNARKTSDKSAEIVNPLPSSKEDKPVFDIPDENLFAVLGVSNGKILQQDFQLYSKKNKPKVTDIRQNDSRSTCYLLSSLASYLTSESGRNALKNSISGPDADGKVTVTFHDNIINQDIHIKVTTKRLLNSEGEDIYSYSNNNAGWVAIMEKALHGYLLSIADIYRNLSQEEQASPICDSFANVLQNGKAQLDYAGLAQAMNILPAVGGSSGPKNSTVQRLLLNNSTSDFQSSKERMVKSLESGIPVICGVKGSIWNKLKAPFTGMPTDHAVSVLGLAAKDGHQGIWIFDPYGDALKDAMLADNIIEGTENGYVVNRWGGAVKFIPWKTVPKLFREVVIGRS
ncbi:MAG: hypothetical protein PUP46_00175 [Endozoicomonas sp. (ex Botrylloides leachii)]|nr:hypothetical protein [Endozoicomonas sp. (ex Botrylloides leachii)]